MLSAGARVPDVGAEDDSGAFVRLRDFGGRTVVLYFYPKADTPGCTAESQAFRDLHAKFVKKGAEVVGVSRDTVAAQRKFKEKYGLNFPLLADVESAVCDAFGVVVEKNMYGKKSLGIARSTFVIAPDGAIAKVWPKVKVEGHADEVLQSL